MKVRIASVATDEPGATVRYECPLGASLARWGGAVEPKVGDEFFVEYTFREPVQLGVNATVLTGECCASVGVADDLVQIVGLIEGLDADGVAFLRLAPDCLALIETESEVQAGTWVRLRLPVSKVELWAIGGGY